MAKEDKSILESLKDLCSSDENSLGGALAAFDKRCADLHRAIQDRIKRVQADVRAKVNTARVTQCIPPWRRPFRKHIQGGLTFDPQPTGRRHTPTIEDVNRSLNELA